MSSDRKMPDDQELEDFLAGLHPVGKAYREASKDEGAPPELDATILTAAREAVRTRQRVPRRPRWFQPVAVAATLALSLGVLLNLWRDPVTREQMSPTSADPDLQRAKEEALKEGAVLSARKAEEAPAAAEAPREGAPQAKIGAAAGAMLGDEIGGMANHEYSLQLPIEETEKKAKVYAGKEADARAALAGPAKPEPPKPEPRREPAKSASEMRPESPSTRSSTGFVPEPPPAQTAPAPAVAAPPPPPPPVPAPRMATQPQSNSIAPPPGAGAAGPADDKRLDDAPAAAPAKDQRQAREKLDAMAKQRSRRDADGAAMGSMAAPSSAPAPAPDAAPVTTPAAKAVEQESRELDSAEDAFAPAPPDVWIRRIRELRERGDEKGARDLLNSFRSRYPDYVLPEDLRAFLLEQR